MGDRYALVDRKEKAHDGSIWSVAWVKSERDGMENIVTGSVDDTVKCWVWNSSDNQLSLAHTMEGSQLGVVAVDINALGNLAVSSSMDSIIRLWDLEVGKQLKRFEAAPTDVWAVCFNPDSSFIASSSHNGRINLFSIDSGNLESQLQTSGAARFLLCVAISNNGKYIAAGSIEGVVTVFSMVTGKELHQLDAHLMPVRSICFSADSTMLLTASDDSFIKTFDVDSGQLMKTVPAHSSWVLSVAFSPDNRRFITSGADQAVKIWNSNNECVHQFNEHTDQVWDVRFNSFGSCAVSVGDDAAINIYSCPS